ncbi:MAG: nucleotidyltransferase family protein [Clostridia bacterium]|nr:nucleotidyltransferase family protein [Clostridia bacterium]
MKSNAIICEFNPIHAAHRYILHLCRPTSPGDDDPVIAVMSGNFTQRGIPAVYDKYTRAESAVRCGADLVLELPFTWCSSGVEDFARGGCAVAAGVLASALTFGSESGDGALLTRLAELKESAEYRDAILAAEKESRGRGSAALFDDVLRQHGIDEPIGANDKLGGEYIRFGRQLGIPEFRPVKRMKDAPSATDVRGILNRDGLDACDGWIAEEAFDAFRGHEHCPESKLDALLFHHCRLYVRADEENDLLRYAAKTARASVTPAQFIEKLPTKKYTLARMRREILFSVLGITEEERGKSPAFTVLLAANSRGRAYLSRQAKNFRIPVITKPADQSALDQDAQAQYARLKQADELYAFLMGWEADTFMKKHPVML